MMIEKVIIWNRVVAVLIVVMVLIVFMVVPIMIANLMTSTVKVVRRSETGYTKDIIYFS